MPLRKFWTSSWDRYRRYSVQRGLDWAWSETVVWEPFVSPVVDILWVSATVGVVASPMLAILTNHELIVALQVKKE